MQNLNESACNIYMYNMNISKTLIELSNFVICITVGYQNIVLSKKFRQAT